MQTDEKMPKELRRNYTSFMNALMRIPKEEGVLTLWKGAGPTVVRAVVLNLGMLAPFDEAKEQLMKYHGLEKETVSIRV